MNDRVFPGKPDVRWRRGTPVERVVRRAPLSAIQEVLSISIHDVVNDARQKRIVADFYRVSRWIENEAWLRRRMAELRAG